VKQPPQPSEWDQVEQAERKSNDMQLLFNLNEYFKLATIVASYIQIYKEARLIDGLIKTEMTESTEGLTTE
jgi:hypothetical protein